MRNSRNAAKLAKRRETRETPRNSRSAAKLQNRVECVESVECAESCRSVLNRVEPSTLPPPRVLGGDPRARESRKTKNPVLGPPPGAWAWPSPPSGECHLPRPRLCATIKISNLRTYRHVQVKNNLFFNSPGPGNKKIISLKE